MLLLKNGHVIPGNGQPERYRADVLVQDGVIAAIGPDLSNPDAEVIDVAGQIVMPGMIDTHRHVWQSPLRGIGADMTLPDYFRVVLGKALPAYRPADAHTATLLGAAEALDAGITTIFDWSNAAMSPAHTEAIVAAFTTVGSRAVVAQETPIAGDLPSTITGALSILGAEYGDWDESMRQIAMAREHGMVTSMHAGGRATARLYAAGVLGPDLQFVHMNGVTDDDVKMLVETATGISVTPLVERLMGHGASPYGRFLDGGGRPALGVDVVINAPGDMFEVMRDTLRDLRVRSMASAGDLLNAVTIDGARSIGLGERTGSLAVGKQADLIVLSGLSHLAGSADVAGAVVTTLGPSDVRTVIVNGEVVKRDGRLVNVDLQALREAAAAVARRVLS